MGNNNSFLSNERNIADGVILSKDVRKALDDIASKNIARYAPHSRNNNLDIHAVPKQNRNFLIDDQYSEMTDNFTNESEKLFIEKSLQQTAQDSNSNNNQIASVTSLGAIKNSQNDVLSQGGPKILSVEQTGPKLGSSPNRSCDAPSRNVVAMILGGYENENHSKKYPAMFQYHGKAKNVYVTGSFNNWRRLQMSKSNNSNEFIVILDLSEGT